NIAFMLAEARAFEEVLSFTKAILAEDTQNTIPRDRRLSDLCVFFIHALASLEQADLALKYSEQLLTNSELSANLKAWIAATMTAHYALEENCFQKAFKLAEQFEGLLETLGPEDRQRRTMLANNIAFAYAEAGLLEQAEHYLKYVNEAIHKEPYPT